jgi:hypothetical protein
MRKRATSENDVEGEKWLAITGLPHFGAHRFPSIVTFMDNLPRCGRAEHNP